MILVALGILIAAQSSPVERFGVLPSATDPAITTFDSAHSIFVDATAESRGQLLLFLPGTNGKTRATDDFCETAATLGYNVINLMYPDDIPATTVRNSRDRDAFLDFRLEVIEGKDLSKSVDVDRPNSIENRLVKLLRYLDKSRPTECWDRFLDREEPRWENIAVSGLSQGAGHAALIAIRHKVARAVLFGGPKDYDRVARKPATWYTTPKTPLERIYTFNHEQDEQGCDLFEQMEICRAMGLDKLGKPVSVDTVPAPFRHSHILTTNHPGTRISSVQAHTSVVSNRSGPKDIDGARLFKPVWLYMLSDGD